MWQNLLNAVLSAVLVIVAILSAGLGAMAPLLGWTFGILNLIIASVAISGLLNEMGKQPHFDHGVQSDL